jgi:PadR family transcriptional regulator, regulatory protein PadR
VEARGCPARRRMKTELLHGTLEVLILKTLSWGPMHGFGIGKWIGQLSGDELRIEEGSLYPALYRLEKKGWIDASWGLSDNQRRAKFYRLTAEGRRQLLKNSDVWSTFAQAVARVLSAKQQPVS